jgi:hypothetical protein
MRRARLLCLLAVLALGMVGAGCSHSAKPDPRTAEPARPAGKGTAAKPATRGAAQAGTRVQAGSSSSAPAPPDTSAATSGPIVPRLTPEEEARLLRDTATAIEAAATRLAAIAPDRLDADRLDKYRLATDFVKEARAARARRDYERAGALALKARLLADELAAK